MKIKLKSGKEVKYNPLARLELLEFKDEMGGYWSRYPEALASGRVPVKTCYKAILIATDFDESAIDELTDGEIAELGSKIIFDSDLGEEDKKKL